MGSSATKEVVELDVFEDHIAKNQLG